MSRESFPQRILKAFTFIFVFMFILLFKDLPRMLFQRRKKIENQASFFQNCFLKIIVVVITGGAMGIGKEVAKRLAIQEKAKVCILDVNEKEGLNTLAEITREGGEVYFFRCDVSDHESLKSVANEIHKDPQLGHVDICVVNAAVLKFGECLDLSEKDYRLNADVNILGHIYTVTAFLPHMMDAEKGHIVSIGSICSYYGEHYGAAYCTAKFACRGFMEALQMELIAKGLYEKIVLTSIYPYFVRTNLIEHLNEPHSTFFDIVPLEKCAHEVMDAILKEKLTHFIPGGIGFLCLYLKCLCTKSLLPFGRKVFNFTYHPKAKTDPAMQV